MKKIFTTLVILLVVLAAIGIGLKFTAPKNGEEQVACTMEAKLCPDGSAVGRQGPNCEFAACPIPTTEKTLKINERTLVNGLYITALKVMEDSRCPEDVTCVWAGRLTVNTKVESPDGTPTKEMVFTEGPYSTPFAGKAIMLTKAMPTKNSKQTLAPADYEFTFSVKSSDESSHADLIRVSTPTSGALVKSPLVVKGEARGNWYFEASFPVQLLDANGKELVVTPAQAKGEWMTTEFVPFEATLTFKKPTTATGTLVLKKDNASGLPEHEDSISIPVKFE